MLTTTANCMKRVSSIVDLLVKQHDIGSEFGPMDSLVDGGFTSVAMVDLMLATEREFDLMIPNDELNPSNFSCICSLALLVARLHPNGLRLEAGELLPEIHSPS